MITMMIAVDNNILSELCVGKAVMIENGDDGDNNKNIMWLFNML